MIFAGAGHARTTGAQEPPVPPPLPADPVLEDVPDATLPLLDEIGPSPGARTMTLEQAVATALSGNFGLISSAEAVQTARLAWETLAGAQGYGRVDLRITETGDVFVLEVNPNPDLSSDAGLTRMARARGWDYGELVRRVVDEALQRYERARATEVITQNVPA